MIRRYAGERILLPPVSRDAEGARFARREAEMEGEWGWFAVVASLVQSRMRGAGSRAPMRYNPGANGPHLTGRPAFTLLLWQVSLL